jgi:methylated-DNA-protein-cysteine methyltransferase-like protein
MHRISKKSKARERILQILAAVPHGRVASYGQIAELAGLPRGARVVAAVLRDAGESTPLPWHRVLNAQGCIAIPRGNPSREEQVRRLRAESIPVLRGRVDLRRYGWQPDLDELLWGPAGQPPPVEHRA